MGPAAATVVIALGALLALPARADPHGDLAALLDKDDLGCARQDCSYAASRAAIDRWLAQSPSKADRAWLLGTRSRIAGQQGDWRAALEFAKQSLASDAGHANAQFYLASALEALGRMDEAGAAFRRVTQMRGDESLRRFASCRAAKIQLAAGRLTEASAALPAGAPADPRVTGCLKVVAQKADADKHYKLAADAYKRVSEAEPTDPDPWLRAMYLYTFARAPHEAGLVLVEFNKRGLKVPDTYQTMYVHTLIAVAAPSDSVRILEQYLAANPQSKWGLESLAGMSMLANNPARAETLYRQLVAAGGEREDPNREGLISALSAQRKHSEVRQICESERVPKGRPTVRWYCAESFQALGMCESALPIYRSLLQGPEAKAWMAKSAYGAGRCLETAGKLKEALEAYSLAPDAPQIAPRIRIVNSKLQGK